MDPSTCDSPVHTWAFSPSPRCERDVSRLENSVALADVLSELWLAHGARIEQSTGANTIWPRPPSSPAHSFFPSPGLPCCPTRQLMPQTAHAFLRWTATSSAARQSVMFWWTRMYMLSHNPSSSSSASSWSTARLGKWPYGNMSTKAASIDARLSTRVTRVALSFPASLRRLSRMRAASTSVFFRLLASLLLASLFAYWACALAASSQTAVPCWTLAAAGGGGIGGP
mmetsp:Transcript_18099/g.51506  ORF Transcript_18099/g.51506 Transcript_18099/m.51506 type:complete len:227 (+) Transcript_18099:1093-1773(+)